MGTLGTQINTPLARAFREIVTAGWANLSDGNVEANTGHFALVHIEPSELEELKLVFESRDDFVVPYPGTYLIEEDSNGNTTVTDYPTLDGCLESYNRLAREFAIWDATCPKCENTGPHTRSSKDNAHTCVCGETWDPTEGAEVTMPRPLDAAKAPAQDFLSDLPLQADDEPGEDLYLVHECGEAFDNMADARLHDCDSDPTESYSIKPESEAM